MVEIVCIGEPLVQFNAVTPGPLRNVSLFEKHVGGPETNVAVCVRKLDHSSGLIGRVGDDELGHFIAGWLRGIDVDTSYLKVDPRAPPLSVLYRGDTQYQAGAGSTTIERNRRGASLRLKILTENS